MKFDMSAAWNEAVRLMSGNRDVLLVVAGVFFFLPNVIFMLVFSSQLSAIEAAQASNPDPKAVWQAMMGFYGEIWWMILLMAVVQGIGMLGLLALLSDRSRPTVGEALKTGTKLLLPYIGAQLLTSLAFVAGSYRTNTDASETTTASAASAAPAATEVAPEAKPVASPAPDDNRLQETPAVTQETVATPVANAESAQADQGSPPVAEPAIASQQTLAERIAATNEWLERTPETHYFIQLLSTDGDNELGVAVFLESISKALDPQQIRVYRSSLSGRERLGVIYGDFATRELASAELARLAPTGAGSSPYIRTVSKLR